MSISTLLASLEPWTHLLGYGTIAVLVFFLFLSGTIQTSESKESAYMIALGLAGMALIGIAVIFNFFVLMLAPFAFIGTCFSRMAVVFKTSAPVIKRTKDFKIVALIVVALIAGTLVLFDVGSYVAFRVLQLARCFVAEIISWVLLVYGLVTDVGLPTGESFRDMRLPHANIALAAFILVLVIFLPYESPGIDNWLTLAAVVGTLLGGGMVSLVLLTAK